MRTLSCEELAAISGGNEPVTTWPAYETPYLDRTFIEDVMTLLQLQSEKTYLEWLLSLTSSQLAA